MKYVWILISLGVLVFLYWIYKKKEMENFVALSGLNPLTTYDDYGVFNFMFHTDDFPYYPLSKPDYFKLSCAYHDNPAGPDNELPCGNINGYRDIGEIPNDSFIYNEGRKIRRTLLGSNYSQHLDYHPINGSFDPLVDASRGKNALQAPVAYNSY